MSLANTPTGPNTTVPTDEEIDQWFDENASNPPTEEEIDEWFNQTLHPLTEEEQYLARREIGILTEEESIIRRQLGPKLYAKIIWWQISVISRDVKNSVLKEARDFLEPSIKISDKLLSHRQRIMRALFKIGAIKDYWPAINPSELPRLVDDNYFDHQLKTEYQQLLKNKTISNLNLASVISIFAERSFALGISPGRLSKFLSDPRLLDFILDEVINIEVNKQSLSDRIGRDLSSELKIEVEPCSEVEMEIKKCIEYYRISYDPFDMNETIAQFIEALTNEFSYYDVQGWLAKNKVYLREIVVGEITMADRYADEFDPSDQVKSYTAPHLENMINSSYEKIGAFNVKEFIRMNLPIFFEAKTFEYELNEQLDSDEFGTPTFKTNNLTKKGIARGADYVFLDLSRMLRFFEDALSNFETKTDLGMVDVRAMIMNECSKHLLESGLDPKALLIQKDSNTSKLYEFEVKKFDSTEEVIENLNELIEESLQIIPSHTDVENLLSDPLMIPHEFKVHRAEWFDKAGNMRDKDAYDDFLRSLFAQSTSSGERAEAINITKKRVSEMFVEVNDYLCHVAEDLGVPALATSDEVKNTNDYASLILIATDKQRSAKERFEARRKLELVTLLYSCKGTPRMVFQGHEKKEVKRVLERQRMGLEINEGPVQKIYFQDSEDGKAKVLEEGSEFDPEDSNIKCIELIPSKFAGTNCYLLPANGEDYPDASKIEYIGEKSLFSMLTKLLRSNKKRASNITDVLRMTFIVDDEQDLENLQSHIEMNQISFGRALKKEDRYGDGFKYKVTKNPHQSDEYRTLRYVVDVPIRSVDGAKSHNYLIPVEIRVITKDDLAKERSTQNDASHRKYEERRLLEVLGKLTPRVIYPERHKTIVPSRYALLKKDREKIKTREDYAAAA